VAELVGKDRELWASRWEAINYMDTWQHLNEGQFLTTIDAPALSLAGACRRKVERVELVEILKCLDSS